MSGQAVEKERKTGNSTMTESARLQELREEVRRISREVAAGTITSDEGTARIQKLVSRNHTFSFRAFGI